MAESLQDRLFQGLQGLLFVLVPREDGKGQGDAVPIREHPHLYDWVRPVLLALSIFFASVFLLYLKVIVRAVVVKDAVIPVYLEVAVLIGFRLYEVALGGKHVQGAVDIMLLIGRLFEIVHCCLCRTGLYSTGFMRPVDAFGVMELSKTRILKLKLDNAGNYAMLYL